MGAAASQAAGQLPHGQHDVQLAADRALDGLTVAEDGLDRDVLVLSEPAVTPAFAQCMTSAPGLHAAQYVPFRGHNTANLCRLNVAMRDARCVGCSQCTMRKTTARSLWTMLAVRVSITGHAGVIHNTCHSSESPGSGKSRLSAQRACERCRCRTARAPRPARSNARSAPSVGSMLSRHSTSHRLGGTAGHLRAHCGRRPPRPLRIDKSVAESKVSWVQNPRHGTSQPLNDARMLKTSRPATSTRVRRARVLHGEALLACWRDRVPTELR